MPRTFREEQAKQGRSGRRVLLVLAISLLLALLVWAGVGFYGESIDESTPTATESTEQGEAPVSVPSEPTDSAPSATVPPGEEPPAGEDGSAGQ